MRYLIAASAVVLLLSGIRSAWCAGNITYQFVNYPAYQLDVQTGLPDSIVGSITTDGNLGVLDISDILSWSFTQSRAGTPSSWSVSSSNPNTGIILGNTGIGPTATPTQLICALGCNLVLCYPNDPTDSGGDLSLGYNQLGEYSYSCTISTLGDSNFSDVVGWWNNAVGQPPSSFLSSPPADPWVIAQVVPEPSTLVLLCIGAVGLLGHAWRRRRQA